MGRLSLPVIRDILVSEEKQSDLEASARTIAESQCQLQVVAFSTFGQLSVQLA